MSLSPPRLHPPVVSSPEHIAAVRRQLASIVRGVAAAAPATAFSAGVVEIPLTTVSLNSSFDAYVDLGFLGAEPSGKFEYVVDSGNSMLIVPRWEDIAALPNWQANYRVLGSAPEPWGCPANVVRGPICIRTSGNTSYVARNCVFYACTGNSKQGERTANFGTGCTTPWSASAWSTPQGVGVVMQAVLSYDPAYLYAEFDYASAAHIHGSTGTLKVASGSYLRLYQTAPVGYRMFGILPNTEWMSLIPLCLKIGATKTPWPGKAASPIAMIDTGGGPVFLSDPNLYVCNRVWPNPVSNPWWAACSTACESTAGSITVSVGDGVASYSYSINPAQLPSPAQGLTIVMCEINEYMRGRQGMNIGGISALVNNVLIDYRAARVGFKPK
jgi:hypothetical protein